MMAQTGKIDSLDSLGKYLEGLGIECIRERFRAPSFPQLSPSAGFLCAAAGAFLLAAGHPVEAFIIGLAGALLLLLAACGFSPLDWLGPKEIRSGLVVPGTFSDERRKALFLAIPLSCRLTRSDHFSREASFRRSASTFGHILSISLPVLAAMETLLYLPPLPAAEVAAGIVLLALSAAEWIGRKPVAPPANMAAGWVAQLVATGSGFRPFVLLYTGDVAEVKFFLAKYRHPLFRGHGLFLEFPESASGMPAASGSEGGFILPYRVDPALLLRVREAALECGVPSPETPALRFGSGGLAAMARGFKAVTLFRLDAPPAGETAFDGGTAISWIGEIVKRSGDGTVRSPQRKPI